MPAEEVEDEGDVDQVVLQAVGPVGLDAALGLVEPDLPALLVGRPRVPQPGADLGDVVTVDAGLVEVVEQLREQSLGPQGEAVEGALGEAGVDDLLHHVLGGLVGQQDRRVEGRSEAGLGGDPRPEQAHHARRQAVEGVDLGGDRRPPGDRSAGGLGAPAGALRDQDQQLVAAHPLIEERGHPLADQGAGGGRPLGQIDPHGAGRRSGDGRGHLPGPGARRRPRCGHRARAHSRALAFIASASLARPIRDRTCAASRYGPVRTGSISRARRAYLSDSSNSFIRNNMRLTL